MNHKKLGAWVAGLCVGMAGSSQAAEQSEGVAFSDVVVTATKRETAVSESPASVTVVTASDMEKKNVARIGDALNQVPSLYLRGGTFGNNAPGTGMSETSLRGMTTNQTLVLVDGQTVNNGYSGKVNWSSIFMGDVERIEVVPGTFSSLYGSNALGGVIQVITKAPDKKEIKLKGGYGWGGVDDKSLVAGYRNKFENGLGVVLGFGYRDNGGYIYDFVVKTPTAGGGLPVTGWEHTTTNQGATAYLLGDKGKRPFTEKNATAKFYYDLSPTSKIHAGFDYGETNIGYTPFHTYLRNAGGNPVVAGNLLINGRRVSLSQSNFMSTTPAAETLKRYFAGYEGRLGDDYLLKVNLNYADRGYWYDSAGSAATYSSGAGTFTTLPNDLLEGSAQLSFPVGKSQFFIVGFGVNRTTMDRAVHALSNWREPDSKTSVNAQSSGRSITRSLYVQDEVMLRDDLTLYMGGRYDHWTTRGSAAQFTAPTFNTEYAERSDSAFSPKLSFVHKLTPGVTLRGSAGTAFRAPGNSELYAKSLSVGITTEADPNLRPERARSWEIGGDVNFESWNAKAAYFQNTVKDLIYLKTISPTLRQRINAGEVRIKGVELSSLWRLASWLNLNATYSYLDTEILKNDAEPLTVGKRLSEVPKNMFSLSLDGRRGPWSGSIVARYVGHVFGDSQNRDTVEGVLTSYDKYWNADLKIGYDVSKQLKASFSIGNLMDRDYYQYYLQPGRTYLMELALTY